MKVLFINPPVYNEITTNVPEVIESGVGFLPPLGILYVAAYLKKFTDYQIKVLDCPVEKMGYPEIEEFVKAEKPDVVGMTALTFTIIDTVNLADLIKKISPQTKIILGGPHVNIYPAESLQNKSVDYLVLGEGEEPCKDLLDNLDDMEKLKQVKGIVFKDKNGAVVNTGTRPLIQDLDVLPFPARELTPYKEYFSVVAKRKPVTTMFTSRGCPYKCIFCDRPHLGKVFRARSAKSVVDEMEACKKLGIKEIFIYDDTFTVDRQRVVDICDEIKRRNLEIYWDVRARVNTVDEELLKMMKEAGCERIHFGVEAGTDKILQVLRKGITLEMAEKAFKLSKKAGIQTLAYFMIGSPTETRADVLTTMKFAKKIDPDFVHVSIVTPFPATELYLLGLQKKIWPNDFWQEFAKHPTADFVPQLWESELGKEELVKLNKKFYKSFYFRPSYLLKRLLKLSSPQEFLAKAKMGLKLLKI